MTSFTQAELLRLYEWALNMADEYPEQFDELDRKIYNKLECMLKNYSSPIDKELSCLTKL